MSHCPCGLCPYLVCSPVAVACWVSSGESPFLQGPFQGEAAAQEEGHHVLELLRVPLQRGQAACAGTKLILTERGMVHPGDTRESSQNSRLIMALDHVLLKRPGRASSQGTCIKYPGTKTMEGRLKRGGGDG